MEGSAFEEVDFFRAIAASGARALLIGRQALIALGLPVLTRDYDYWVHIDDAGLLNAAVRPFDLQPNRTPEEARAHGGYVLQNDEVVDVPVEDLILTKRFGARPKDAEDIRLLEAVRSGHR